MRDLAARAREITGECTCHEAYKGRGLIDHACIFHAYYEEIVEALRAERRRVWKDVQAVLRDATRPPLDQSESLALHWMNRALNAEETLAASQAQEETP